MRAFYDNIRIWLATIDEQMGEKKAAGGEDIQL